MRLPAQRYAVFAPGAGTRDMGSIWQAVLQWLALSPWRSAHKPDFELYPPGADPLAPSVGVEIWLGVEEGCRVRSAVPGDEGAWLDMRHALWPDAERSGHAAEIEQYFAGELSMPLEVLVAAGADGAALGFVELSIRPYAEGCRTDRVAYLEGWYVVPHARRRGVGRALVEAAERWALAQGCSELASDALLENEVSVAAHEALGFEEVERIRCFRKDLPAPR
jgi:aminoglycoside 6'-N-acetyltransferase I